MSKQRWDVPPGTSSPPSSPLTKPRLNSKVSRSKDVNALDVNWCSPPSEDLGHEFHEKKRTRTGSSSSTSQLPCLDNVAVTAAVWGAKDLACRILQGLTWRELYGTVRIVTRGLHYFGSDSLLWTKAAVQGIEIWQLQQLRGLVDLLRFCRHCLRELSFLGVQAEISILNSGTDCIPSQSLPSSAASNSKPSIVKVELPLLSKWNLVTCGARGEIAWAEWVLGAMACPGLNSLMYNGPMTAKAVEGLAQIVGGASHLKSAQLQFSSHSKYVQGGPLCRLARALLAQGKDLRVLEFKPVEGATSVVWSHKLLSDAAPEILQALLYPTDFSNVDNGESNSKRDMPVIRPNEICDEAGEQTSLKGYHHEGFDRLCIGYATDEMCHRLKRDRALGQQQFAKPVLALSLLSQGSGGQGLSPLGVGSVLQTLHPTALEQLRVRCEWDSTLDPSELDQLWFPELAVAVARCHALRSSPRVGSGSEEVCFSSQSVLQSGLPRLRELNCFGLRWNGPLLRVLVRRCPALEAVRLHNIGGIDDAALKELLTPRLVSLSLRGRGGQISDSGARALLRCRIRFARLQNLELDTNRHMSADGVRGMVRGLVKLGCLRLSIRAWDPSVAVNNDLATWVSEEAPKSLVRFRCGLDLLQEETKMKLAQRFPQDFYQRDNGEVRPFEDRSGLPFWDQ